MEVGYFNRVSGWITLIKDGQTGSTDIADIARIRLKITRVANTFSVDWVALRVIETDRPTHLE